MERLNQKSILQIVNTIGSTVATCKKLLEMPQTPANLRGYLATEEGLALMLFAEQGPGNGAVVEIGSFLGKSTCWLGLGVRSGNRETVSAIDVFRPLSFMAESENDEDQAIANEGSTLPFFLKNIEYFGLTDQVLPIQGSSLEVAGSWAGGSIRFLFIDGNHEYESVCNDFNAWSSYVQRGGIIAFHDYSDNWPGVKKFYDELMESNPDYTELLTCYTTKFVIKN